MSIADKLKHMVIEDEAPKHVPPRPIPVPSAVQTYSSGVITYPAVSYGGSQYEKMRLATDFDQTDVGKVLKQFSAPLDGIVTDERQKFKAVLALAKGYSPDKILSTFDWLAATLSGMRTDFDAATAEFKKEEIDGRQSKLNSIQSEIAAKQAELATAQSDLTTAQNKLQSTTADFVTALDRRKNELSEQKQHYASLMENK